MVGCGLAHGVDNASGASCGTKPELRIWSPGVDGAVPKPGTCAAMTEARLGSTATVELSADEIARLAAGEVLPFASVGDGPNHGHCGLAFRADREPRELPAAVACVPRGTAMCMVR